MPNSTATNSSKSACVIHEKIFFPEFLSSKVCVCVCVCVYVLHSSLWLSWSHLGG